MGWSEIFLEPFFLAALLHGNEFDHRGARDGEDPSKMVA